MRLEVDKLQSRSGWFSLLAVATMAVVLVMLWIVPASEGSGNCATVTSFRINNGAKTTTSRLVTIQVKFQGSPTHYVICEDPEFVDCNWKAMPYDGKITYELSEGNGVKTIYFRAKRFNRLGEVVSAQIELISG